MARKAKQADPVDTHVTKGNGERRYRSIAEIRRDLFPQAPASLFETGTHGSWEDLVARFEGKEIPNSK